MIWMKTEAGRLEMQTRRLVKERARRNLLLLIDGIKSEEMLLSGVAGISAEDFRVLRGLSLIAPVALPPPPVAPVATCRRRRIAGHGGDAGCRHCRAA